MIRYDALPKSQAARLRYDPATRREQPRRAELRTGYHHDSARHQAAREKVDPARRAEIARMGGQARAKLFTGASIDTRLDALTARINRMATRAHFPKIRAVLESHERAPVEARAAPPAKLTAAQRAAASRPARRNYPRSIARWKLWYASTAAAR